MFHWLTEIPTWLLGLLLFAMMMAAALAGYALRQRNERKDADFHATRSETQEGYIVGSVLTLLGLLIGFTFAMAVDRYEARRLLVLDDANAIEELYLRAQLLDEPHRSRYSDLLVRYTDNHLALAELQEEGPESERLLAGNDRMLADLWTITAPAFDSIRGIDFSTALVDSANHVIELDASRKAARQAQIPAAVFAVLFIYAIITAAVLGYVLNGKRGRLAGASLLALFTLALMLLSDINRPVTGAIRESQGPMERLRRTLQQSPPALFDRLKAPAEATPSGTGK